MSPLVFDRVTSLIKHDVIGHWFALIGQGLSWTVYSNIFSHTQNEWKAKKKLNSSIDIFWIFFLSIQISKDNDS